LSIKVDEPLEPGRYYTAFMNDYKEEGSKQPDYKIVRPREQGAAQGNAPAPKTGGDSLPF
jgi:hypothetical protein